MAQSVTSGNLRKAPREYEKQIQKLEADVRTHIRVEQQLKLHIEGMQQQFDDMLAKSATDLEQAEKLIQGLEGKVKDKDAACKKAEGDLKVQKQTAEAQIKAL